MLSKIDVRKIVSDHLNTLTDYGAGKRSTTDLLLFLGVPVAVAAALTYERVLLSPQASTILITSLSIFTGLLLNLLLLIHSLIHKADAGSNTTEKKILCQLYANISYDILIAVIAISILIVAAIFCGARPVQLTVSALSFALVLNFLLTILMILKRVYALLDNDSRRHS